MADEVADDTGGDAPAGQPAAPTRARRAARAAAGRSSTSGQSSGGQQSGRGGLTAPPGVNDAAGAILGVLVWLWVGLPLLTGGPSKVKNVLRAKFFNKGPDGKWLG